MSANAYVKVNAEVIKLFYFPNYHCHTFFFESM